MVTIYTRFKAWEKVGICKVHHVLDHGYWRNVRDICQIYGLPEFLVSFQFTLLKKAFPIFWIQKMRVTDRSVNNSHEVQCIQISSIDVSNMKTKYLYSVYLQKKQIEPDVLNYWQETLSLPPEFNWHPVFLFNFYELKYNKIKQFNFKLFHRFYLLNGIIFRILQDI